MKRDEFLQVLRSPFHFATCDAVLRGCKIVDISKPLQWRRLSKKVRLPLGPLCEGAPPQAVGERTVRRPKYFGLWQGSLPPPLRGTAPPLAQAPPPPYRGSLSRRGRFFDMQKKRRCPIRVSSPFSISQGKKGGSLCRSL